MPRLPRPGVEDVDVGPRRELGIGNNTEQTLLWSLPNPVGEVQDHQRDSGCGVRRCIACQLEEPAILGGNQQVIAKPG